MKILLIGEYSNFHNNLKDGLVKLGHDVLLASRGDSFKKLSRDIEWNTEAKGVNKLIAYYKMWKDIRSFSGYDVVQLIGPGEFTPRFGFHKQVLKELFENNRRCFMLVAADDCVVWNYFKDKEKSSAFDYNWVRDIIGFSSPELSATRVCDNELYVDWTINTAKQMDGVIPIAYEYWSAYAGFQNLRNIIRMPINTDKIAYEENIVRDKLVVFHGLNREGAKGTYYIRKAFEELRRRYPSDLELVIDGKMPFREYVKFLTRVNVVVDQTSSYSLAMNALTSMAMGKIVLGGAEPDSVSALGYDFCPAINIKPDVQQIKDQILSLLDNKSNIPLMGAQSRAFVEKHHHYEDIAREFVIQYCS